MSITSILGCSRLRPELVEQVDYDGQSGHASARCATSRKARTTMRVPMGARATTSATRAKNSRGNGPRELGIAMSSAAMSPCYGARTVVAAPRAPPPREPQKRALHPIPSNVCLMAGLPS